MSESQSQKQSKMCKLANTLKMWASNKEVYEFAVNKVSGERKDSHGQFRPGQNNVFFENQN